MKSMMKSVVMLALVCISTMSFAQQQPKPADAMNSRIAKLTERLQLNQDQQAKIREVLVNNRNDMKAMRDQAQNASKEDRMKMRKTAMEKLDNNIMAVLDAGQQEKYKAYKAELREERRANRGQKMSNSPNPDADDAY